jgi:hypothetical protein
MLEKLFQTLGLNSSEITAYLALAELGKASASVIAKRLKFRARPHILLLKVFQSEAWFQSSRRKKELCT